MYERLDRTDLWQFGFDGAHFQKVKGGREWHGPCPWCGGKDRLIISNGMYWCRQCNKGGKLVSLLKEPPSPEEVKRLQEISDRKRKAEEARAAKVKEAKLRDFNHEKPWVEFHQNLLNKPEILALLERDGITMNEVEWYDLGYVPKFRYAVDGQLFTGPGITFPIRSGKHMHNLRVRLLSKKEDPTAPLEDVGGDKYRPYLTEVGAGFFRADFPDCDWVVIVEGEKKAIVLWKNGIPAIGIQGCWTFKDEWIGWFKKRFKFIYLALDPDQRAHKSEERLAEALGAQVIWLDEKPDDAIVAGHMTIPQLIEHMSRSHFEKRRKIK